MLEKTQRNCTAHPLLMRLYHDIATLENGLAISYKSYMPLLYNPKLHSRAFIPEK